MCSTDDMKAFLGSLPKIQVVSDDDVAPLEAKAATPEGERFDCDKCHGTGIFKGVRLHQPESKCFACNGRGWFRKSYGARMADKAKRAQRKIKKAEEAVELFDQTNPGIVAQLKAISGWNTFAVSMLDAIGKYGALTTNQLIATERMLLKVAENEARRAAEKAVKEAAAKKIADGVDASKIEEAFKAALESGLKKPKLITERIVITVAKNGSGALYVKRDGQYVGKIAAGTFKPVFSAPADTAELLSTIAADPQEAAKAYGRATGTCSCCGRTLTDPVSIEAGIGPICAGRWF